jgi:Lrp/AsnC family transcriptional regulator for asnA, asnC and gidA
MQDMSADTRDGGPTGTNALDPVDLRLVAALQEDGRIAYRELGRKLGISESGARRRTRRLLDSGLLRVVGVTDVVALGFIRAEIGIRVKAESVREVARRLSELREADWVATCIGPVDVVVNVICTDHRRLVELIDREIRTAPGVDSVETRVIVDVVKDDYRMLDIAGAAPEEAAGGDRGR